MTVCEAIANEVGCWDRIPKKHKLRSRLRTRRCDLDKYMVMQALIPAIHDGIGWYADHGGNAWSEDPAKATRNDGRIEFRVETEVTAVIALRTRDSSDREGKILVQAGVGRADARGITKGGALIAALGMEHNEWWHLANGLRVLEKPTLIVPRYSVAYWRVGGDYNYALHLLTAALA